LISVALNGLRQLGVRLSIDDFGTGYSSLAYLGTLPIDSLKIDRSFVIGMHNKPENVEIVRAVFNLGQTLGMSVVAEGIETGAQLDALKAIGVHIGQGNGLSVPLSPAQVPALFRVALRTPL
jgi:EAL domain-containing protein (putative c-di-GMP-specific phosphodiesterase class I)